MHQPDHLKGIAIMIDFIIALLFAILPPCATEDSAWCKWDASTMGNGTGHSFIALAPADPAPMTIRIP